jgi:hypothetical protein
MEAKAKTLVRVPHVANTVPNRLNPEEPQFLISDRAAQDDFVVAAPISSLTGSHGAEPMLLPRMLKGMLLSHQRN